MKLPWERMKKMVGEGMKLPLVKDEKKQLRRNEMDMK
jgi:hypothetical protein